MAFSIGRTFDHAETAEPCATCHFAGNTFTAPTQPVWHTETTDDCAACHDTSSFAAAMLDHDETTLNCASCHVPGNNWGAPTQPDFHVVSAITSNDCTDCHNAGEPPTPVMNHIVAIDNSDCVDCHFTYQSSTLDPNNAGSGRQTHDIIDDCLGCHF
jgi:predicted CxxxxCH...CXXCH cytochrome family protein